MSTVRRGNGAEVEYAKLLDADGWAVGSRRHIPGPGDLLATRPGHTPRLIEVKCSKNPYQCFRRGDRREMSAYAARHRLDAELVWREPGKNKPWHVVPESDWPRS